MSSPFRLSPAKSTPQFVKFIIKSTIRIYHVASRACSFSSPEKKRRALGTRPVLALRCFNKRLFAQPPLELILIDAKWKKIQMYYQVLNFYLRIL